MKAPLYDSPFILTLVLGIQRGVLVGVILSLLFILQKVSRPHHAVLGKLQEYDVRSRNLSLSTFNTNVDFTFIALLHLSFFQQEPFDVK